MDLSDYALLGGGLLLCAVLLHALLAIRRGSGPARDDEPGRDSADSNRFSEAAIAVTQWRPVAAEPRSPPVSVGQPDLPVQPPVEPDADGASMSSDTAPVADPAEPCGATSANAGSRQHNGDREKGGRKRLEPRVPRPLRAGLHRRAKPLPPRSARGLDEAVDLEDVIVVWMCAKPGCVLNGRRLLDELSACGLLFYSDRVFRKSDPEGGGDWYTVANGVEPGTFDVSEPTELETPRIAMLLRLGTVADPAVAFEDMLGVAGHLAEALGGDLKDDRRSDMGVQTVEYCRQRIREYKRIHLRA